MESGWTLQTLARVASLDLQPENVITHGSVACVDAGGVYPMKQS